MACTAFPLLQKFRPQQIVLPPWLDYVLKNESNVCNFPKKASDYLKCIQSLSEIKKLEIQDYFVTLTLCLYLEQYEINEEMKRHALKNHILRKTNAGHCFIIDVPSLTSENTVIVPDDKVNLYHFLSKTKILAKVVKVSKNEVTIQLLTPVDEKLFCNVKGSSTKFDINFVSQHWPLNCCHYAISALKMCNWIPLIYPKVGVHSEDVEFDIKWVNRNVAMNEQQKQAVKKILNKTAHPAPYIIFGPPGTGKTATLVETICQIVRQRPADNILVCATSNTAADEVTVRLIGKVPDDILLRIYAQSRRWGEVPKKIQPYANFIDEGVIYLTKDLLIHKKIIITTLVTSVRLVAAEFRENHFSYIIIDEASQAIEPEMLIPFVITYSSSCDTDFYPQVVITGDPHQLGPIVRSKRSEHLLGISMLERLMINCEPYKKQDGKYNPNYITKLIKNYRSHEKLLHIPNKLFYDGDLIACGGSDTNIALNWSELPKKNFPMIFQEVRGEEERTSTKSVYNEAEALVALHYVKMLINAKFANHKITAKDIGIITPFKRQQQDIIQQLAAKRLEDVTVGTVEIFQGREKPVIIISTVRSKTFEHNGKEHIGFLSNRKRFNVALTRAKALTIVIGDPNILCTNIYWKELWEYCKHHGACIPFVRCPLKPNAIQKLMSDKNQNSVKKLSITIKHDKKTTSETLCNVLVRKMHKIKLE